MRKITQQSVVKKNLRIGEKKTEYAQRERERERHKEYLYSQNATDIQ